MNARRTAPPLVATTLVLTVCLSGAALGQEVGADIGPYDPLGIRAGSFFFFPSLAVSELYDDNVFATDNNTKDDFITNIHPEIRMQSNFSRHSLGFTVGSDIGIYASETDSNFEDYFATSDGRLDITRNSILTGAINGGRFHEERDDPENVAPENKLTKFWRYGGEISYLQLFNRFNVRVTGNVSRNDYDDAGNVNNDDRDNVLVNGILRAGFFVSPRINVFTQGRYGIERRDETPDDEGFDRDRDEWEVSAGTEVDLTDLLVGEVFFGYVQDLPKENSFNDQGGFGYGLDLTWTPTRLTTVTLGGGGDFESTTTEDAEARFRSTVSLDVEHELLRNVLLGGNVGYIRDDFDGINRTDDTIEAGASVSYLINRNFSVDGGYNFSNRWSDSSVDEFTRNIFRIGVTGRL